MRQITAGQSVLLIALVFQGCRAQPDSAIGPLEPVYDKTTGRLQLLIARRDANGDGQTDRWDYYGADRRLQKFGFSTQSDGREDAWAYVGPDGSTTRIESSPQRNGRIQRIEHFEHDLLTRAEEDTDGDGKIDKWEIFEGARLASVAYDTTHRGSPDRRIVYETDGRVRVEVDSRGDGRFVEDTSRQ